METRSRYRVSHRVSNLPWIAGSSPAMTVEFAFIAVRQLLTPHHPRTCSRRRRPTVVGRWIHVRDSLDRNRVSPQPDRSALVARVHGCERHGDWYTKEELVAVLTTCLLDTPSTSP